MPFLQAFYGFLPQKLGFIVKAWTWNLHWRMLHYGELFSRQFIPWTLMCCTWAASVFLQAQAHMGPLLSAWQLAIIDSSVPPSAYHCIYPGVWQLDREIEHIYPSSTAEVKCTDIQTLVGYFLCCCVCHIIYSAVGRFQPVEYSNCMLGASH